MMASMPASLSNFVVLLAVTSSSVRCAQDTKRPLAEKGLLIGEDTPVWIAYRPDPEGPVNYTRLKNGIINETIDYWLSNQFPGSFKAKRSIDDYANFAEVIEPNHIDDFEEAFPGNGTSKFKRSPDRVEEFSFLLVMDYNTTWQSDESVQKKYIKEKILYAMAFWNGFNLQLRHITVSKIRLRIAGIVIGRDKETMPYLRKSETDARLNMSKAFTKMNEYWTNMSSYHMDFPNDSYHFVATMTDSKPKGNNFRYYWDFRWKSSEDGPATVSFLFNDDLAFSSLPRGGWRHMQQIGFAIRKIAVRVRPYKHLLPEKTIETLILPGQLVSVPNQCEGRGYNFDQKICPSLWNDLPCRHLRCVTNNNQCQNSGPHLVGTPCGANGKICLDVQCLEKPQLYA